MTQAPGLLDADVDGPRPVALFDLDGSLINGSTLVHIVRRCGVYREARQIWSRYGGPASLDGEGLQRIAALLEGERFSAVEEAVSQLFLRPESGEIVNALKDRGFAIGLVADSFHVSAEKAAERLGVQAAAGARLEVEGGIVTGTLQPAATGDCARWLCREAMLARFGSVYQAPVRVAMGDSVADRCMLEAADLGIASERADEHAIEAADVQASLMEVPRVVDSFLEQEGIVLDVAPMPRRRSES